MGNNKKKSLLYVALAIALAVVICIAICEHMLEGGLLKKYFLFAITVLGGFIAILKWLNPQLLEKVEDWLRRLLGITKNNKRPVDKNPTREEDAKEQLLCRVKDTSLLQLAYIKDSTPIISSGHVIKVKQVFYPDLEQFRKDEKETFIYEGASFRLLRKAITGQPGSGKSFYIIRQVKELIDKIIIERQQGNCASPVPVYLSLSSWSKYRYQGFKEWVTDRLNSDYKLSDENSEMLVEGYGIIVFADGLDEIVSSEDQLECFKALLEYAENHGIVFSCRKEELKILLEKVEQQPAGHINVLELENLSEEIIKNTVQRTQGKANDIIAFLDSKKELYERLNSSLLLNLFLKVFNELAPAEKEVIKNMEQDALEVFLWEKFDELILGRYENTNGKHLQAWPVKKVRTYMVALAKRMPAGVFYSEDLQPSWLGKPGRIFVYYFTSRIICGLILAMCAGLIVAGPADFIGNGIWASLITVLLTYWSNHFRKDKFHPYWATILVFSLVLVLAALIYQGFSVPRMPGDMVHGNFSVTESYAGILLGLFFGGVFGYRKSNQNALLDVRPLEQGNQKEFNFNWSNAFKTGLRGALALGFFFGFAAIVIVRYSLGKTFHIWLEQNASYYMGFINIWIGDLYGSYPQVFLLGSSVGFLVGFIISGVMGGRGKYQQEDNANSGDAGNDTTIGGGEKQRMNSGIWSSLVYAFRYGVIVMAGTWLFVGILIYYPTGESESLKRAFSMGIGAGIIALLWFGGFEALQHSILRFYLYVYGITPLSFTRWRKIVEKTILMKRRGAGLQFYHNNLQRYYADKISLKDEQKVVDLQRKGVLRSAFFVGIPSILLLIAYPFFLRFINKAYWQSPDETVYVNSAPHVISQVDGHTFLCKKDGVLNLAVSGKIKAGTFVGMITAAGTERGILGFPITDVYDFEPDCRHGALIYQVVHNGLRTPWKPVVTQTPFFNTLQTACIPVKANDTIYFKVNDIEWQNNKGHFSVGMTFSDTCKKQPY